MNRRRPDDDIPASDAQPLRVLMVDDDANYSAYLAALGRRVGFRVETAPDAETALALLTAARYDAVVIDYEMPRMNGVELIMHLRAAETTRGVYAVMLTAHDEMATKLAALDAGFDDFVVKSSEEVEIVAKLAAARRVAARQRTMDIAIRELYGLATRDELTGLFNRRFFVAEVERMLAHGTPVSIILFDLDDFKQVNDNLGHLAGDRVLRDAGALFHRSTRPEDIVARFGGDEFVMAIPQLDLASIQRIAQRLASEIRSLQWDVEGTRVTVSISTGVGSSHLLPSPTLPQLLNAADRDMYKNKWLRKHREGVAAVEPRAPSSTERPVARDLGRMDERA